MKILKIIIGCVVSFNVFGFQSLNLNPNDSASAKISSLELSRIFVEGERIKSIRGMENTYIFKSDNTKGEIYLKPTPLYQTKMFTVFINTESGRTFTLLLTPVDVPSQTIMIKSQGIIKKAEKWERILPYEGTLVNLVLAMFNETEIDGFEVKNVIDVKPKFLGDIATLKLLTVYNGNHLTGEVFEVKNRKKSQIVITEKEFYKPNARAIALKDHVIEGGASTLLYVITGGK